MKPFIRSLGHTLHILHNRAYTYGKVQETGVRFSAPLNYDEQAVFLEMRPLTLEAGIIFFDIGAANGVMTRCFAKLSNILAVHAFEPIPAAFAELTRETRNLKSVTCHNVAIGEANKNMDIHVFEDTRDSSSFLEMRQLHKDERPWVKYKEHIESVKMVRLDDYVNEKSLPLPNIIKVDVQGYEANVLRGGNITIAQCKYCILELSFTPLYEESLGFDDIYQDMRKLGFKLIGLTSLMYGKTGRWLQVDGVFQNERLAK